MRLNNAFIGRTSRVGGQDGMALVTVMMVMMLISVLMVGFVAAIVSDNRASGLDRDQTQAYAASHAGLEKLTSDLSTLFTVDFSPSAAQVNALAVSQPSVYGFTYVSPTGGSGYTVTFSPDASGNPKPLDAVNGTQIKSGPYQGFKGIITQYDITTTARSTGGAEVRMRRSLQTIAVPVFQFGMFSETDLAFHAGESFAFGGRVHTNANLYLANGDGETLTLFDRVTALGEIVRTHLPNGLLTTSGYDGPVRVPLTISTNPTPPASSFRNLLRDEGSLTGTIGSSVNEPKWTLVSVGTYGSNIRNGRTGTKKLELPLVAFGAKPVDLVRRPRPNENVTSALIYGQRYYTLAALRILLSDTPAELTTLPHSAAAAPPVDLTVLGNTYAGAGPPVTRPPFARVNPVPAAAQNGLPANVYKTAASQPLLGGVIKIEQQRINGLWYDVTQEILGLGIAGRNLASSTTGTPNANGWNVPAAAAGDTCVEPNPNAVIRLQRVRDVPVLAIGTTPTVALRCGVTMGGAVVTAVSQLPEDYWPMALYDTREGNVRDGILGTDLALGGIMSYVELDVNNLRRWILGQIGATGTLTRNENGYIIYFSDRRNNKSNVAADCTAPLAVPCETGEYGWEDIINPATPAGLPPNNVLDVGEDLNANGRLDVYGGTPQGPLGAAPYNAGVLPTFVMTAAAHPNRALIARANRIVHYRRALKLVNGLQGNIITPGMTVASENPVYVHGNFNATAASVSTGAHAATAIVADSVTLLSNAWTDINSFKFPNASADRDASTTGYRVAVVSGKGLAFPKPAYADSSFGSDGGAHNFLRQLEDWNSVPATLRYRGSMVSFYISRQATGTFKCCQGDAYTRGPREMAFDSDFLTPSLLPPGTPMFRDVNTLTFRQLLRPTQ